MANDSSIEWTDATWNPVRGCAIVSPGCTNCYAMKLAHRFSGKGRPYDGLTKLTKGGPVWTGKVTVHTELLEWPIRRAKPSRIFVNSMSDLFHDDVPDIFIADVFAAMAYARHHTFQVLTKRPERLAALLASEAFHELYDFACDIASNTAELVLGRRGEFDPNRRYKGDIRTFDPSFPLKNVWLGCSVEDARRAVERLDPMGRLSVDQWLTWVSYEPALELVNWQGWEFLRWLVSGGESGPGARPSHPDWHRAARDWCRESGVSYFFKQWGSFLPGEIGQGQNTLLWQDGRTEWYGDHADIKYSDSWLSKDAARLVVAWPTSKKKAGRQLDGRTHDEYPA